MDRVYCTRTVYFQVLEVAIKKSFLQLVSGLPVRNGIKHASQISMLALAMRREIAQLTFPSSPDVKLRLRVGINSGKGRESLHTLGIILKNLSKFAF